MATKMTLEQLQSEANERDRIRVSVYAAFGIENITKRGSFDEEAALARKLIAAQHCCSRGHPPMDWGEDTKDGKARLWFIDDGGNKLEICAKD